jgi:hypothetical protein
VSPNAVTIAALVKSTGLGMVHSPSLRRGFCAVEQTIALP